jgi:hypothetical protein
MFHSIQANNRLDEKAERVSAKVQCDLAEYEMFNEHVHRFSKLAIIGKKMKDLNKKRNNNNEDTGVSTMPLLLDVSGIPGQYEFTLITAHSLFQSTSISSLFRTTYKHGQNLDPKLWVNRS